ncbi:PLP-dependent transferase [Psychroserpens sp. Hel_I_66]|uniref:PLP-dependent transferase n=1 Tax=Psychroserpens sp. Hel_I_66 TaxID=1250004 RepID=UPI000647E72B|nr:PLP-dependent transferase [Psychroserpens sp. Hel_I_66]
MQENHLLNYIKDVIKNIPENWRNLTTHRLDIYNEDLAKFEFLQEFESLYKNDNATTSALENLPTAYDYIRLGHPLSCVLEWTIAKQYQIKSSTVISFDSKTIPVLAILRTNLLEHKNTRILYSGQLPEQFDPEILRRVYGYSFELQQVKSLTEVNKFKGSTVFISNQTEINQLNLNPNIDFYINLYDYLGSVLIVNGEQNDHYISEIQHVRRRETVAMTPTNSLVLLNALAEQKPLVFNRPNIESEKKAVLHHISEITNTPEKPLVASSGLSIQYAIMMGLIHDALDNHKGKAIKIIVPPNCYGGTNDQARRVAACLNNVDIVDLPVDGDNDMVQSIHRVLDAIASQDAIPFIIAEIPTNPRVEVPNLKELQQALTKERKTLNDDIAIDPVFILDQTFCPNVQFLGKGNILSSVRTISYASGSKFPSGGRCTAGYCVGNKLSKTLMQTIEKHLILCDNEATVFQYKILAEQMPSMIQRIEDAYKNTREFVTFIEHALPQAKINFVSQELAKQGFTPSVFSLGLPTKGDTEEAREAYKRELNLKLINLMITEIPEESKFCVSYGQLKGCYWTVPATSTQGTTKEGDKDYIVRASVSPDLDLAKHKTVFIKFVESILN